MNELEKDTAVEGQLMDPITVLRTERSYLNLEELHVPGWVEVIVKYTGGYEWDFFGAWYDSDARIFYWHRDSGCSCNDPGDSVYTIGDLNCGRADELTNAYKDWAAEEYNDALTNAEKVSATHDIKAAIKTALAPVQGRLIMAGYVYRGSRVRKMRGEEFDRKHGVVPDVQEKPRAKAPQKRAMTPMTKTPQRPAADFEIVCEDPPQGVSSVNGVAARAAAKALHAAPGQWHRVARVADAAAAKSYISTLRNHVQRVSTRTVRDETGRRAVYAMSRPLEGEE